MSRIILTQSKLKPTEFIAACGDDADRLTITPDQLRRLGELSAQYQNIIKNKMSRSVDDQLLPVGQGLFAWLKGLGGTWWQPLTLVGGAELVWRFRAFSDPESQKITHGVMDAPWEILAQEAPNDAGFFLKRKNTQFAVIRHWPGDGKFREPSNYRLNLLFMAAAPLGEVDLDYRAEEVAIETAAGEAGIDLTVDETGHLDSLAQTLSLSRARLDGETDVLHLSCHGMQTKDGPYLALETEEGLVSPTSPGELSRMIRSWSLQLGFISACETASGDPSLGQPLDGSLGASHFAAQLVELGLPSVVAWGGSVGDHNATRFAQLIYQGLGRGESLGIAWSNALARFAQDPDQNDWHMPRLLISESSDMDACFCAGHVSRRQIDPSSWAETGFLGHNRLVPIATFEQFVGRRRELQRSLKALKTPGQILLLQGSGNLGKSSLAGRLLRRLGNHHHIVVHGQFTDDELAERIRDAYALGADEPIFPLKRFLNSEVARARSMVLVMDDFEQLLVDPEDEGPHQIHPNWRPLIHNWFQAFATHGGESRLVVTSRYTFDLSDAPATANAVQVEPLSPFNAKERQRQTLRLRPAENNTHGKNQQNREERAMGLSSGNPGLLRRLLDCVYTEAETADKLLDEVAQYLNQGHNVSDRGVADYLDGLAIDKMLDAANADRYQAWLLQVSREWSLPLPIALWQDSLMKQHGCLADQALTHCQRLVGFGLWDAYPDPVNPGQSGYALGHLIRPRIVPLSQGKQKSALNDLLVAANQYWVPGEVGREYEIELLTLAVALDHADIAAQRSERGLQFLLSKHRYAQALPLAKYRLAHPPAPNYNQWRIGAEVAQHRGESVLAREWLEKARNCPAPTNKAEAEDFGVILALAAKLDTTEGRPDEALALYRQALDCFNAFDLVREVAVTKGQIADILVKKGDIEQAMNIRQDEQLPVYEQLGDRRELLICQAKLALIHLARKSSEDRERALELLMKALMAAVQMGLPEANQILAIMTQEGLMPDELKALLK